MHRIWIPILATFLGLAACQAQESELAVSEQPFEVRARPDADTAICRVTAAAAPLPGEVRETSGLARSLRDPDLFWTHNDAGNGPELFTLNARGELARRVEVSGARLVDWEDIEAAPCDDRSCLYIADIGDNDAERDRITVYRIPEPDPTATRSATATAFDARFPDGPRDAEGLFVLPPARMHVVTKGRRGDVAIYRYPASAVAGSVSTLEHVRRLFPEPDDDADRVTAATASPDGQWVAVRTYRTLHLYRTRDLLGDGTLDPIAIDLSSLDEPQGEAVVIADDGRVWLSSEAGEGRGPLWSRLRCQFPSP